jgi:hypothetical protein
MHENVQITTTKAWRAWKKNCAAERCGEQEASMLRRFGASRFNGYVQRYAARTGHRGGATMRVAEAADGWSMLESHVQLSRTRAGKRYKDWLFARARLGSPDEFLALMESGASLLMRSVVKEHLRKEHAASFMTSLQAPRGRADDGMGTYSLEDLLPDAGASPADEIAEKEWRELADQHAGKLFAQMNFRESATLWARGRGIHFSDRRFLVWMDCGESMLYKIHRRFLEKMVAELKNFHVGEDAEAILRLVVMTHENLEERCAEKFLFQKETPRCFRKV